jgi:uncharacterized protein (TIGR03118 family)
MFTSLASKGLLLAAFAAIPVSALWADDNSSKLDANANSTNHGQSYEARILVTNDGDPNLVNGWGVAFNPNAFVWVSAEGTGKATLYDGNGVPQSLVVTVAAANGEEHGSPTGIVFNSSNDFAVSNQDKTVTAPARFIFATGGGLIAGWAPTVEGGTQAVLAFDGTPYKAAYTGITISGNGTAHVLYAADFRNGHVDMFDAKFGPLTVAGAFVDSHLPRGYSPFNVQAINGDIYVTYAKQDDDDPAEEVTGPGLGIVNAFDPNGKFVRRVATKGALNAPWGITISPASFGPFGGALLIGNLGDGTINAYGAITGAPRGALRDRNGKRIHIDGLWGLAFGNGVASQDTNALFFAAGPDDEQNGAYGVIRVRSH